MLEFRQDAQALVLDNRIYVIGGRDFKGERGLDSIECFDVAQKRMEPSDFNSCCKGGFQMRDVQSQPQSPHSDESQSIGRQ